MRTRSVLAFCVSFALVAAAAMAQAPAADAKKPAPKAKASRLVKVAAADVKWTDLDPKGAPGVKIADMWGNHAKGAFGAFLKFPAGFKAPLHTHTSDYRIVVLSGTFIQEPDGKDAFRLGPGSYLMQPGGAYKHTTACDQASECEFFVQSTGKFDLLPVEAPK
jgi:anti-sigma factor ChrR (cupin superfamily)